MRPPQSICDWQRSPEAADAGLLSPELPAGIRRVKGVRRIGMRLGNWLTPEQGRQLAAATRSTPRELRDYAMLAMLIGCGLPRAELLALTVESIQQREEDWVSPKQAATIGGVCSITHSSSAMTHSLVTAALSRTIAHARARTESDQR